jgi:hypothetical protein
MKVHGSCHCGRIRFEAEADPEQVAICHCTDCQKLTGCAWRVSVTVPGSGFTLLAGQPKVYVKTAESGTRRAHRFCPDCGTPLYACPEIDPKTFTLRIGCLDERAGLPPRRQIWCRSALPWSSDISGVPSRAQQ